MIPLRWKIWALVALVFVAGLLRWRSAAVDHAIERLRTDSLEKSLGMHDARNRIEDNNASESDSRKRLHDEWSR